MEDEREKEREVEGGGECVDGVRPPRVRALGFEESRRWGGGG